MTSSLERYLEELTATRASGAATKETSGYGALANLFNALGHTLKPRVRCFFNLSKTGAGIPDGQQAALESHSHPATPSAPASSRATCGR